MSTFDPPLTLVPRSTHIHVDASYTCGVAPGRTVEAVGVLDGQAPQGSCLGHTGPARTEIVRYADGERSVIVYPDMTTVRAGGALYNRLTGRVVEGRGKGRTATRTTPALSGQPSTDCLTPGLRGSSGHTQLEIHP
ncbi:hypothetical protein [Streptomyces albireticuli]|uniref:hypothetical protein n=1 Tax=Streptomyces albireticuli TaxID=1940 RepID=UPI00117E4483|nr:hypothetical protein [Streptomyces albireticuli]MCD9143922.1 hypothetical protein [Streptomyces albireticuli]MCD9161647.1 hypothetical protein [Streptomyces albireticuli]MCD9192039.1 hypothetical protein [Streptomyces albireticuli]